MRSVYCVHMELGPAVCCSPIPIFWCIDVETNSKVSGVRAVGEALGSTYGTGSPG